MSALYDEFDSVQWLLVGLVVLLVLALLQRSRKGHYVPLPPSPLTLPVVGHFHLLGPLIHRSFASLASKHGPLIYLKLGSIQCVVASTPDLAREVLKTNEIKFLSRGVNSCAVDRITYGSSFAFEPCNAYWKLIKRLSQNDLLGSRPVGRSLPIRTQEVRHFLGLVYEKCRSGETINLTQEFSKLTHNVMCQMMLSIRGSDSDKEQAEACRSVIGEVTKIFGEFNVSDFIWLCKDFDLQGFRKRVEDIHQRYDSILEDIIETRDRFRKNKKKDGGIGEEEIKDFLDVILNAHEDPNSEMELTRNHVKAVILDFFTAATDTTSSTLEWSVAELMDNPKVLEKAKQEINNVIGTARLVQESDIPSLPYINAVIKETLRLHPPIPMVARKSTEEAVVDGYRIPADCLVFINAWAIGRDPKVWDRPMEYEPERFLGKMENDVIDVNGHNFELLPFGSGRRGCPGRTLAMLEVQVALAGLIQCFDWVACGPKGEVLQSIDMSERPGLTVRRATDLVCLATPRPGVLRIISAN